MLGQDGTQELEAKRGAEQSDKSITLWQDNPRFQEALAKNHLLIVKGNAKHLGQLLDFLARNKSVSGIEEFYFPLVDNGARNLSEYLEDNTDSKQCIMAYSADKPQILLGIILLKTLKEKEVILGTISAFGVDKDYKRFLHSLTKTQNLEKNIGRSLLTIAINLYLLKGAVAMIAMPSNRESAKYYVEQFGFQMRDDLIEKAAPLVPAIALEFLDDLDDEEVYVALSGKYCQQLETLLFAKTFNPSSAQSILHKLSAAKPSPVLTRSRSERSESSSTSAIFINQNQILL